MWELDYKESWVLKNWCFWTVGSGSWWWTGRPGMLWFMGLQRVRHDWATELNCWRKLLGLLDCKKIQPVHPKGNQSWIFTARTDVEAETPMLWPPDVKKRLTGKDPDAGKDWRWEEKGTTEYEMVGGHHWLNGHEFEQAPGVGDGQGSLACCSLWGCKESDTTEQLNWTEFGCTCVVP